MPYQLVLINTFAWSTLLYTATNPNKATKTKTNYKLKHAKANPIFKTLVSLNQFTISWQLCFLSNQNLTSVQCRGVIQARMVPYVTLWRIFRKISKFQNSENCMPRTDTYDKLTSTNAFSHLPLSNHVIFLISLLIKRHNVTFWGT